MYTSALFALSSIPGVAQPEPGAIPGVFLWVPPKLQNALHVPVFAGLAGLWCWSLRPWTKAPCVLAAILAGIYAVMDEWYQSTVPGRFASLGDLGLNLIGIALGLSLAVALSRRRSAR